MTGTLRRLPVPVSEPFACRATAARRPVVAPTQGALALALGTASEHGSVDPWAAPQPTPSSVLPDPKATCTVLVQAVVEVLAGTRPASQLVRWLSADVYAALQGRARIVARQQRRGDAAPVADVSRRRAVVTSVRLCHPTDGVVEGSVVVRDRGRVRAVAVRLEGLDGRWRATALEVG